MLENALYGPSALSDVFSVLQNSKYVSYLNVAGNSSFANDRKRVLSGSISSIPTPLFNNIYFNKINLASNNFSGQLPDWLADTFLWIDVSDNPNLSGPLPPSLTESIEPPVNFWTYTQYCDFENTGLCVPSDWQYQPTCIQSVADSLNTCGENGTQTVPVMPLGEFPMPAETSGVTGIWGGWPTGAKESDASGGAEISVWQGTLIGIGAVVVVMIMAVTMVRRRRQQAPSADLTGNTGTEFLGSGANVTACADAQTLPAYAPPTPMYSPPAPK
ncbi:hypothetical protein HDU83_000830 [Entophlyctis luteolus]|nr:hypothetical protein HDU83_000830 [Entophlyctis luteolus]